MSAIVMTYPAVVSDLLAQRYGTRSPRRRLIGTLLLTALVTTALVWLGWTAWFHSTPGVRGGLVSFTIDSDRQVSATYDTLVRDSAKGTCLLQALAVDHAVVGETRVSVTTSGRHQVSFRTERRADAVTLLSCASK